MIWHSKADLPFKRLTVNLVAVIDPVLPIILRGVSVASIHSFALLCVWSTIKGGLGFYFCYFGNAYSIFDILWKPVLITVCGPFDYI